MRTIGIGVIGCGYWGSNLVRNLVEQRRVNLRWICDLDDIKLNKLKCRYPFVSTPSKF